MPCYETFPLSPLHPHKLKKASAYQGLLLLFVWLLLVTPPGLRSPGSPWARGTGCQPTERAPTPAQHSPPSPHRCC